MFGLIFGITFAICGLIAIMVGRRISEQDRAIAGWPRAPGTITASHLEKVERTIRDNRGMYTQITVPTPIVKYTYTADGRELQGDRISRYTGSFTSEAPQRYPLGHAATDSALQRYPLGHAVSVYYDPAAPTTAYLEAPQPPVTKIFAILGYTFLVLGIVAPLIERLL